MVVCLMSAAWWRSVRPGLWSFAATSDDSLRARKLAVLSVLLEAGTRMPMVGLDELRNLLAATDWDDVPSNEDLRSVLEQLHKEKLVVPFRDWDLTSSSYSDARRRKESWTLTHEARVSVQKVQEGTAALQRPLQMPPGLLVSLNEAIGQVLRAVEGPTGSQPDDDDAGTGTALRLEAALSAIGGYLDQLRSAAGDFYEALASLNQEDVTQNDVFLVSRQRIVMVLDEFVRQTENSLEPARQRAARLLQVGHARVAEQAVDAAGLFNPDRKPQWIADEVAKLEMLDGWLATGGAIDGMVGDALEAIRTLLGAIERRFHAHARGSDLAADFRQLARMLHVQTDEQQAQQVFAAAFGMWSARHPRRPDFAEAPESTDGVGRTRVEVSTTLRRFEPGRARRSAPRLIPDTSAAKQLKLAAEAVELARLEQVCRELLTEEPVGLEYFDGLSLQHAAVLIDLIEQAMDAFDPAEGSGWAANALCELRLWPVAPAWVVALRFDEGVLRTYDLRVHITSAYPADRGSSTGAAL